MARYFIMKDYLSRDSDTDSDSSNDALIQYSTKKYSESKVEHLPRDFPKMCRVCMTINTRSMTNIFDGKVGNRKIFVSIEEVTNLCGSTHYVEELFYAITGCDSTSKIASITKKGAWKSFQGNACSLLQGLGSIPLTDQVVANAEEFVVQLYKVSPEIKTGDAARSFLFGAVKNAENLPPTSDSLRLHIRRCHYQLTREDELPKRICDSCLNLLTSAITFKDLCLKSEKFLRKSVLFIKKESDDFHKTDEIKTENKNDSPAGASLVKVESLESDDFFDKNDDNFDNDSNFGSKDLNFDTSLNDTKTIPLLKTEPLAKEKVKLKRKEPVSKDSVTSPAKKLFSCTYCRKIYKNATVFNNHLVKEHAQSMRDSKPRGNHRKNLTTVKTTETSVCDLCEQSFENKHKLLVHLKVDHFTNQNVRCPKCPKNFDDHQQYIKHRQLHKNLETYLCEWCAKPFKSANNLKAHLRIHNNEFPFACSQCPYRARVKDALRSHMRTHTGERPYACDACPATFSCKSNLNGHIRRTHKQIKAYKCPVCGKEFSARQPMLDHKSCQHDGIKRYNCPVCGSQFGYKKGLRKHLINVHKKEKRSKLGKVPNYQIAQEKAMASQQLIAQGFY